MTEDLQNKILEQVKLAQQGKVSFAQLYSNPDAPQSENEFCFFIKPEVTLESDSINFDKVVTLAFNKLKEFGLEVSDIKVLGADYLKEHNIIAQHYGVINKLSREPQTMSDDAKNTLKEFAGVNNLEDCNLMGGLQFLEKYPAFNAFSLDVLWQNNSVKRLAGGTYCEKVKVDTDTVYLINAFHPRQLHHFTEAGRNIVVFTLVGDLGWADARQKFIGATNPEVAEASSLRKELLNNQSDYGIPEVSQGLNGFHLSAGPVEGLVELIRYNSNYAENKVKTFRDFSFGRKLAELFTESDIESMLGNTNVEYQGKTVSVFDLTEEKSSNEAINLLKEVFKLK